MPKATVSEADQRRKVHLRLRVLRHFEVTKNASLTCRFFGISRTTFYDWRRRHRQLGESGLRDGKRGPKISPWRTPAHIERLVLEIRRQREYGALRISFYLQRYHNVYLSTPAIARILREHKMPRVSLKRYRPGPKRKREFTVPGQSVQVDVKHVKLESGRYYQFTAIDEATRFRVLRLYDHNSVASAIRFVDEVRKQLPIAIHRIQTDNGSEFGTDFTWHLHDLGIRHKHIPPGCPESNGKVERSHRTDEYEFYRRSVFHDAVDLRRQLREWESEYNDKRPHLALRGHTPAERLCELRIRSPGPVRQLA